jgi:hypothetical protein
MNVERHFGRAGGANDFNLDFNLVNNQSRGHVKKLERSSTYNRVHACKTRQRTLRFETYSKSLNMFALRAR